MLSCIPPKETSINKYSYGGVGGANWAATHDDFYTCHLGDAVQDMSDLVNHKIPTVAITSNSDISSWNTNADIVFENDIWPPNSIDSRIKELYSEIVRLKAEEKIHSQLIDTINKGYLPPIHRYDWYEE